MDLGCAVGNASALLTLTPVLDERPLVCCSWFVLFAVSGERLHRGAASARWTLIVAMWFFRIHPKADPSQWTARHLELSALYAGQGNTLLKVQIYIIIDQVTPTLSHPTPLAVHWSFVPFSLYVAYSLRKLTVCLRVRYNGVFFRKKWFTIFTEFSSGKSDS